MASSRAADTGVAEHRAAGGLLTRPPLAAALATAVPAASAAPSPVRQQPPAEPDFGPNVRVFGPGGRAVDIAAALAAAERSGNPYTVLLRPGGYDTDLRVGSCTSVYGLGLHPDDVTVTGAVRRAGEDSAPDDSWWPAENLTCAEVGGVRPGAAVPARRVHLRGTHSSPAGPGHRPDGPPAAAPAGGPPSREKPFLYLDEAGGYRVFLPALRHAGAGPTWGGGRPHGSSVPLDRFFVARPGDSVRALNKALSQGRHLLLTPGVHRLADTIRVKWAGTVVLGLGHTVLTPLQGAAPMTVADARGVRIAGLLFDAGSAEPPVLLEVGARRGGRTDPREPASLHDVFFRVGAAGPGLVVNSDNVLLDHVRAWPAGPGAAPGVVVHGDHVRATGPFAADLPRDGVLADGGPGRTVVRSEPSPSQGAV
jgi:hypothetical protein